MAIKAQKGETPKGGDYTRGRSMSLRPVRSLPRSRVCSTIHEHPLELTRRTDIGLCPLPHLPPHILPSLTPLSPHATIRKPDRKRGADDEGVGSRRRGGRRQAEWKATPCRLPGWKSARAGSRPRQPPFVRGRARRATNLLGSSQAAGRGFHNNRFPRAHEPRHRSLRRASW